MLRCTWLLVFALVAPACAKNYTVMVFGDSWGSLGPSWHEIQDMFDRNNVTAVVKSAARGGTTACQWAEHGGISMAYEAKQLFPNVTDGPDFVWYTLGGNDLVNKNYANCSLQAKTFAENLACMNNQTQKANDCTAAILTKFFEVFPKSKVMQCGYDIPCADGGCVKTDDARNEWCGANVTCMNEFTVAWQDMLVGTTQRRFPQPQYTGLNILGTVQAAGGVPGAATGSPNMTVGSPCELMHSCVHPEHGKSGATAIGDAFWRLFFSKHL